MKIVLFTHIFPYPLNEGGKVAQFGIIRYLCRKNEIILVSENSYSGIYEDARQLNIVLPELRIEILDALETKPTNSFANAILNKVNQLQWRLQKVVNKKQPKSSSILDNNLFIYPTRPRKPTIINQLLAIIQNEQPDLIQVDFIDNADLVNVIPSNIKSVLVHHDLRFASVEQACKLENQTVVYTDYLRNYVKSIEAAFLYKFDAVVTFNLQDREKLITIIKNTIIEAIPFPISNLSMNVIGDEAYTINKLVFIGPHYHLPNYDALQWYANEMSEEIFKRYNLKLVVIGNWSEGAKANFKKFKGIEFVGFVDDLNAALQNAIMIVPLRIGSGIRTKLLDAFSLGVPVISTSVGCEGLGAVDQHELLVSNTASEFVEAIEMLISNPLLVQTLRRNANDLIMQKYTIEKVGGQRLALYKKLINELVEKAKG